MSSKSFALIQKSFAEESENIFQFLRADFGFSGPEFDNKFLQTLSYARSGMRCRIMFDHSEMSVLTEVEVESGGKMVIAGLDSLVAAAEIAPGNAVPHTVHSAKNLRKVLTRQAEFLRLLLPHLEPGTVNRLMERAGARQWNMR